MGVTAAAALAHKEMQQQPFSSLLKHVAKPEITWGQPAPCSANICSSWERIALFFTAGLKPCFRECFIGGVVKQQSLSLDFSFFFFFFPTKSGFSYSPLIDSSSHAGSASSARPPLAQSWH